LQKRRQRLQAPEEFLDVLLGHKSLQIDWGGTAPSAILGSDDWGEP
jgi:hypothetical protein